MRTAAGHLARLVVVLALTAGAGYAAFLLYGQPKNGIDDAQIFLVYGQNLASGEGFVYNAGGERVEGASSLAWTALCVAAVASGVRPEIVLLASSVILSGLAIWVVGLGVIRFARLGARDVWLATCGLAVAVLASASWSVWSQLSLMETALWGLLLALGFRDLITLPDRPERRESLRFSALAIAMLLTRPESLVVVPLLILGRAWIRWGSPSHRRQIVRFAAAELALVLGAMASLMAGRLAYFGYPFPNTYYAKVSPSVLHNLRDGVEYLATFLGASVLASAATVTVVIVAWGNARSPHAGGAADPQSGRARRVWLATAAFATTLMVLPLATGGDHFAMHRLYQPVLPILIGTALAGLLGMPEGSRHRALRRRSERWIVILGLTIAAAEVAVSATGWRRISSDRPALIEFQTASYQILNGEITARIFSSTGRLPSVAVLTAGGFKRSYRGPVLDLFGLNHVAMGHSPGERLGPKGIAAFDAGVFFAEDPDLVLPIASTGSRSEPPRAHFSESQASAWDVPLRGLLASDRFESGYWYARVWEGGNGPWYVEGYFRKPFLQELAEHRMGWVERLAL